MPLDLKTMTVEELGKLMPPYDGTDIKAYQAVIAEFNRRQALAQIDAAETQKLAAAAEQRAADATVIAASHAGSNAKYMLWSVVFAAVSAFISLLSTVWTNWPKK
jgi:hypothetical protein